MCLHRRKLTNSLAHSSTSLPSNVNIKNMDALDLPKEPSPTNLYKVLMS